MVISNSAYRRTTLLAYKPVLGLLMDFHTSKDSGEVLKVVEQASSLNTLVEMVLFDIAPIFLDCCGAKGQPSAPLNRSYFNRHTPPQIVAIA
jgi:ABC-type transport system involved in Fe-S cluster assembly fused permease/ATPase subunit